LTTGTPRSGRTAGSVGTGGGAVIPGPPRERTLLGHPAGLAVLFFTEMWERFSYYGMRALLVLYMVNHLFIQPDVGAKVLGFNLIKGSLETVFGPLGNQPLSSQIYGLYTAFVYLTPFFGGMLADRILGQRKTVVLGAILMAIGHFLMASQQLFFVALMFLIMGNGAFKPNISTQVGALYAQGDPRRDRAFTIFYMGINLGACLSPLVCGTLGQTVGWHYGFAAAGVGMLIGLFLYLWGRRYLAPEPPKAAVTPAKRTAFIGLYIAAIAVGLLVMLIVLPLVLGRLPLIPRIFVLGIAGVALVLYITRWMLSLGRDDRLRVGALMVLCALNIVFWGVYEQQGNTMQLWADQNTNWHFLGVTIPSTWYQSFNPAMIFIMAPLLNMVWAWQARRNREPSSVTKMAMGCFLLGISYIVMIIASGGMAPDAKRNVMWLTGTTFVLTIGELYLSPIGLSLVTKVAPARIVSMMMGIWFLSSFFGNYLSGYLGTYWEKIPHQAFFLVLLVLGVSAGIAMFAVGRPLNKVIAKHE
jgi:proton-dependent oligopeptide transporter, POT family